MEMPPLNDRWESIDYESTSILVNGSNFYSMVIQGYIGCIITFALRAKFITIPRKNYENELKTNEKFKALNDKNERGKIIENKWTQQKIEDAKNEYKFEFSFRLALEFFLEMCVLSFLNIRYVKLKNIWQIFSFTISITILLALLTFYIWEFKRS